MNRPARISRLACALCCTSILLIGEEGGAQTVDVLRPGVPVLASIRDGQTHRYTSSVSGEVRIVVENLERGVLLTACRPDCRRAEQRLTRSATWRGPEHFHSAIFVADERTVIELTPDTAVGPAGAYRVTLEPTRRQEPDYAGELAMSRGADLHAAYWWDGASTLRDAIAQYQLAADVFLSTGDLSRAADALFEEATVHIDLNNFDDAYDRLFRAEEIWTGSGDRRGIANARNLRGLIQLHFGNELTQVRSETAISLFEAAAARRSADGEEYFLAQTLNNLGLAHLNLGEGRLARRYFADALTAASGSVDLMAVEPMTFDFAALDDAPWLDDALTAMMNLGAAHDSAANPVEAIRHYEQALKLAELLDTARLAAEIRSNYGALNYRIGRLEPALEQMLAALAYFRDVARDEVWEAQVQNNLGLVYHASGDRDRAAIALGEALRKRSAERDPIGRAQTLRNLASLDLDNGDIEAALSRIRTAFSLSPPDESGASLELAILHGLAGRTYLAAGDVERSLHHHDESVRLFSGQAGHARALSDRAWALHVAGRDMRALPEVRLAIEIAVETDSIPEQVRGNTFLARIHADRGEFADAVRRAGRAVSLSNEIRAQIRHPALLRDYASVQQDAYDVLIRAHIALQEYESAWTVADGARARRFRELLRQSGADLRRLSADEKVRFEEISWRVSELGQQRTEFLASGRTGDAEEVRRELLPLTVEMQSLLPSAGEDPGVPRPEIAAADIQTRLNRKDVLLEFHFADAWAGVWAIRSGSMEYYELSPIGEFGELVDQVRGSLDPFDPSPDEPIRRLSTMIFGEGGVPLTDAERLIVVPDGPLHFVPLSILMDPESDFREPLIALREILYLPSASAALALDERSREPGEGIAILADPVYGPNDPRIRAVAKTTGRQQQTAMLDRELIQSTAYGTRIGFVRLQHTVTEANAIRDAAMDMNVVVAFGTDANRDFVMSGSLSDFRYVHFATHGVLDIEDPASSGLVLSGFTADGAPRYRYLRTADIANLELSADLVVLSGCDTGLGKAIRGEGLLSLSRAFFHAGAQSVVSSLWQVPDAATAELMAAFYGEMLGNGSSPAQALRAAQLHVSADRRWRNPYFWAAFVIQGPWESPRD